MWVFPQISSTSTRLFIDFSTIELVTSRININLALASNHHLIKQLIKQSTLASTYSPTIMQVSLRRVIPRASSALCARPLATAPARLFSSQLQRHEGIYSFLFELCCSYYYYFFLFSNYLFNFQDEEEMSDRSVTGTMTSTMLITFSTIGSPEVGILSTRRAVSFHSNYSII